MYDLAQVGLGWIEAGGAAGLVVVVDVGVAVAVSRKVEGKSAKVKEQRKTRTIKADGLADLEIRAVGGDGRIQRGEFPRSHSRCVRDRVARFPRLDYVGRTAVCRSSRRGRRDRSGEDDGREKSEEDSVHC